MLSLSVAVIVDAKPRRISVSSYFLQAYNTCRSLSFIVSCCYILLHFFSFYYYTSDDDATHHHSPPPNPPLYTHSHSLSLSHTHTHSHSCTLSTISSHSSCFSQCLSSTPNMLYYWLTLAHMEFHLVDHHLEIKIPSIVCTWVRRENR